MGVRAYLRFGAHARATQSSPDGCWRSSFVPGARARASRCVRCVVAPTHAQQLVRRERECEIIDRKLVKEVVEIFVEMGGSRNSLEVYVTDFEDMLLSTTADFYSRESSKWAEEDSFPDYMCKAEDRLQQEQQRVANYLHSSTEEKLLKVRAARSDATGRRGCGYFSVAL